MTARIWAKCVFWTAVKKGTYFLVKFVFFEKATKFDEISILLLPNKIVFLCFPPNFEFSVSYASNLSGAP